MTTKNSNLNDDNYAPGEEQAVAQETAAPEHAPTGFGRRRPQNWHAGRHRAPDPRYKSPFLAAFLSVVPGLGQIYVGYYTRGFVNAVVVGGIFSVLFMAAESSGAAPFYMPLTIIFLIFFWLYNVIDAWRRALMYNLALEGLENIPLPDDMSAPTIGGSMAGGVALALGGTIILLHTKFGMPAAVFEQWWPVVPIALGAYLIYRSRADQAPKHDDTDF